MIKPNMATMLGFVATDAGVAPKLLKEMTRSIANLSFNRITVDGDTSTNDSFVIMATGQNGIHIDSVASPHYPVLYEALANAARDLAQKSSVTPRAQPSSSRFKSKRPLTRKRHLKLPMPSRSLP